MEQNLNDDQDSVYDPAEDWLVQDEVSEAESHRLVSHEVQTESVRFYHRPVRKCILG